MHHQSRVVYDPGDIYHITKVSEVIAIVQFYCQCPHDIIIAHFIALRITAFHLTAKAHGLSRRLICKIESCDLSDTSLNDITHKGSSIISSTLSRAFLVNTKLASLKLDGSDLSEIYISSDLKELKGAELDVSQALDVIKLIGVKLH